MYQDIVSMKINVRNFNSLGWIFLFFSDQLHCSKQNHFK